MGALIAGVSLSTFPYALDVTAKVTSLRDFFVTLFFVGLGMAIPVPSVPLAGWALAFALFAVVSRVVTTFVPLYKLGQGLHASLVPAINLCQISEFSLVVLALGLQKAHVGAEAKGMVTFAFVLLAPLSTLAMTQSDSLTRTVILWLRRIGLRDLDKTALAHSRGESGHRHGGRILILGFFRIASSLLEELAHRKHAMLEDVAVVDFNPEVFKTLTARGVRVDYGDISQRDTLIHAGVQSAQMLVCTLPDALLKGMNNTKMVRQLRELNPGAKIIVTADVLTDVPALYGAGADYVSVGRLDEAANLCAALEAADAGLLEKKRAQLDARLANRDEVVP